MKFKKSLIALALSSTLVACGGGSSSSSAPKVETPAIGTPVAVVSNETIVEGKAVKGVLNNAVVTVYKFVDGVAVALTAEELSDTDIVTDDKGNYTFTVSDYNGPIKIELSPSTDPANPTTMICDAPSGCGSVVFGDSIDLTVADPSFKLAAISVVNADNSEEVTLNVSALTHLAAELIEADENGINAEVVAAQSATVASNFGITGDITLLEPTVTTNANDLVVEDNEEELRYGLINAGIMEAIFSGETGISAILSTKLANIADDLVINDGALLVNQDSDDGFELSLVDVLTGAANAANAATDAISAAAIASGVELTAEQSATIAELAQEEVNLANQQAYQEANVGDDGLVDIGIEVPTEGDAIDKAKAMVADVRLFSHLFDVSTTEGAGIKTQGDEYVALLDDASAMISQEADNFTLLAKISDVVADLAVEYKDGTLTNTTTSAGVAIPDGVLSDAGTGTITYNENTATGGVLFSVNATDAGEIVQLDVAAEFAADGLSLTLTLDGLVESAGATFTIKDGSFAKVEFDSVATRTTVENETFDGEIISGELELQLELAQKPTAAVTNPVTFSGMLKTKLLPTSERFVDNDSRYFSGYNRPELKTVVLPEMLSLSGGFSSLEGDSVTATLTVNINNLAEHEAPDFKYIGREIADVLKITLSEDLNTFTLADGDIVVDEEQTTGTRIYTAGSETGAWEINTTLVPKDLDAIGWTDNLERKYITRRFDAGLDKKGVIYSEATAVGLVDSDDFYFARTLTITPVDYDGDSIADAYSFEYFDSVDDKDYDGTSISTLLDSNGNLLTSNGQIHPKDNGWMIGEFDTIDQFLEQYSWVMIANPLTVTNGSEFLAQALTHRWNHKFEFTVENEGGVRVYFDEDELATIAAGDTKEYNPTAYLTAPLLKDFVSIEVSDDSNTVTTLIDDEITELIEFSFTGDLDKAGNFELTLINDNSSETIKELSKTTDVGLDVEEVLVTTIYSVNDVDYFSRKVKITPVDTDQNDIADRYEVFYASDYSNSDGVFVDDLGDVISTIDFGGYLYQFNSYNDDSWNLQFEWLLKYNPFNIDSAITLFKETNDNSYNAYNEHNVFVDDVGIIEYSITNEEVAAVVANSTTLLDAQVTSPDGHTSFEDEDNYLNVNAALTLEVVLGEYDVKAQLSGQRTALEQGEFGLELTYGLPGENAQRSFTVNVDTQEDDKLTVTNFENVVLVLEEADEDVSGTQVIGQILVGPTAIVAATIEDRDGLIVIVYGSDDEDTINEIEVL